MATAQKRIGILVEFNYEDLEVWYPLLRFREEGMCTFTIGPEVDKVYQSKKGYPCKSDKSIDTISADDLDVLIIPGGFAPDYWRRDERFVSLVQKANEKEKVIGSICHGPWLLCSARIIKDRKLTCFCSIKDDVINAGGIYQDASVVVDGNLVTSRVPTDLPDFCKAILGLLK
ncbi:Protein DJ-1-like protein D-like [Oopsacas minuta]|uniref:Protein DJ-1-like protein D-like n=1 Tax=Oopsacas minuta TaxID=111878 RepID=A0AAV7K554_9METZ|nr:Protein DJ-1-like protein D-like [Oopsacas minuta]